MKTSRLSILMAAAYATLAQSYDFTQLSKIPEGFKELSGFNNSLEFTPHGLKMSVHEAKQAPTLDIATEFQHGRVDLTLQSAPGTGIVTAFSCYTVGKPKTKEDEIDFEILGVGLHLFTNTFRVIQMSRPTYSLMATLYSPT